MPLWRGKTKPPVELVVGDLDLETTGLDEEKNQIIEIGALKIIGSYKEEFHQLLRIDENIPDFITQLTGITKQILNEEGKDRTICLKEFVNFIGDMPLVGYNIKFDIKFLEKEFSRLGLEWKSNRHIDILSLVKRERMFLDSYKFSSVLTSYGIETGIQHRALEDVKLLDQLVAKLNEFETEIRKKS